MPGPMPADHVTLLCQALEQNRTPDRRKGRKRLTFNFRKVSDESASICGVHYCEKTVRKVQRRLAEQPKKPGPKPNPAHDPEVLKVRVYHAWATLSPASLSQPARPLSDFTKAELRRLVNDDGGASIGRTTFEALLPEIQRRLSEMPQIRYTDPSEQDLREVIRWVKFESTSVVRVAAYALTYKPLILALLWLLKNRPDVQVRLLYDKTWCHSSVIELEAIVELARAGAKVKHLRSYSMHIKGVCVDYSYCWSGSGNFSENAAIRNAEMNTEVTGNTGADDGPCRIFDKYFDEGFSGDDGKWHKSVAPTEQELDDMVKAANKKRLKQVFEKWQRLWSGYQAYRERNKGKGSGCCSVFASQSKHRFTSPMDPFSCATCKARIVPPPLGMDRLELKACGCCKALLACSAYANPDARAGARRCNACANGPEVLQYWPDVSTPVVPTPPEPRPDPRQERMALVAATMGPPLEPPSLPPSGEKRPRRRAGKRVRKVNRYRAKHNKKA